MTAIAPKLHSGSLVDHFRPIWAGYYSAVENIIGNGGIIVPLLDPDHVTSATTFTQRAHHTDGLDATWTYTEAPTAFDTPHDLSDLEKYQGCIPFIEMNGSDEHLETPDADYWHRDDAGGANGFSIGAWINQDNSDADQFILGKTGGGTVEWRLNVRPGYILRTGMFDPSLTEYVGSDGDAAGWGANQWTFVAAVYNGVGGASAAAGITQYVNGTTLASTAWYWPQNSAYVGMENTSGIVEIGRDGNQSFFDSRMAGGPMSPFWTTKQLTAQEVYRLYLLGAAAMGLH